MSDSGLPVMELVVRNMFDRDRYDASCKVRNIFAYGRVDGCEVPFGELEVTAEDGSVVRLRTYVELYSRDPAAQGTEVAGRLVCACADDDADGSLSRKDGVREHLYDIELTRDDLDNFLDTTLPAEDYVRCVERQREAVEARLSAREPRADGGFAVLRSSRELSGIFDRMESEDVSRADRIRDLFNGSGSNSETDNLVLMESRHIWMTLQDTVDRSRMYVECYGNGARGAEIAGRLAMLEYIDGRDSSPHHSAVVDITYDDAMMLAEMTEMGGHHDGMGFLRRVERRNAAEDARLSEIEAASKGLAGMVRGAGRKLGEALHGLTANMRPSGGRGVDMDSIRHDLLRGIGKFGADSDALRADASDGRHAPDESGLRNQGASKEPSVSAEDDDVPL